MSRVGTPLSLALPLALSLALMLGALSPLTAQAAAGAAAKPTPARIDFQAQAQRSAANDMGYANTAVELAGPDAAQIAAQANATLTEALTLAKGFPKIVVRTGNTRTWPIYGKSKSGATAIESWRVRAELNLESRDAGTLGVLLGQLQNQGMSVASLHFAPAPETRRKVEDDTAVDAIRVFREKAARYAGALKRPWRIRSLAISSDGGPTPRLRAGAMAMAQEGNVVPTEPGESLIVVNINGQIELIE